MKLVLNNDNNFSLISLTILDTFSLDNVWILVENVYVNDFWESDLRVLMLKLTCTHAPNTSTSWTTPSCAKRNRVTLYIPELCPVPTATQTTNCAGPKSDSISSLQWGKEGYRWRSLTPTGTWRGKVSLKRSFRPDKKRRNCQSGKQIQSTIGSSWKSFSRKLRRK